ncbi:MAG: hypothetical protein EBZ67_15925, partial [Chitinophagia bacterium]|nr:hypothetical protein [Chitinophagia bacterium]
AMQWVIVDYVNVVVHVFLPEARRFYRLEEMWSDAGSEEHVDGPAPAVTGEASGYRTPKARNIKQR